jgi:hypothetical protein
MADWSTLGAPQPERPKVASVAHAKAAWRAASSLLRRSVAAAPAPTVLTLALQHVHVALCRAAVMSRRLVISRLI